MKKLLVILLLITVAVYAKAQDAYAKDLPEYTTVANDSTDVLYIDDSGIDKHIEMPTLIKLVSDSTNQLRQETADSIAAVKALVGGGGAWSVTGDVISPTSANDTVDVGVIEATYLNTDDGARVGGYTVDGATGYFFPGFLHLSSNLELEWNKKISWTNDNAYITFSSNLLELVFRDPKSGTVTLSDLISGSGDVGIRGTPLQYQIPIWYDADEIQGNSNFTFKEGDYFWATLDYYGLAYMHSFAAGDSAGSWYQNSMGGSAFVGIADGKPQLRYYGSGIDAGITVLPFGKTLITGNDSIELADIMYYTGGGTPKTAFAWMYVDSSDNNKVLLDSSVVASSYGLRMPMQNIFRYFFNRANGEMYWYYQTDSLTIAEDAGVLFGNEPPGRTIEKLVVAIEHLNRRIFRMSLLFIILFGWCGYQQYQIRKLNNNNYLLLRK